MPIPQLAGLFPGQGSQFAGMNRTLLNEFPWTKDIYEEASDAAGLDLRKLCLEGPDSELQKTEFAQPSILTTSYAWFQVLKRTLDFAPATGAGHSLGEYSALLGAGAMTLAEAAPLVRERGRLMQETVPQGVGKMAAVLGLTDDQIRALCQKATQPGSLVVPANFNSPGQVVIAGHAAAVDRAEALAATEEFKARKVMPLKVSAPFHCPLMKPVAEKFFSSLTKIQWKTPAFSIVHNLNAKSEAPSLAEALRDQIDHPVLWTQCQLELENLGATIYVEMGPGKVLSGLGKRIVQNGTFFSSESIEDFKKVEAKMKELCQ